jgi:diacylglycerol diphosphate phosphatase / phosphatidate phosphatase
MCVQDLNATIQLLILWSQRHHKEDVITGSMIGLLSASICYLIYWPNPFSASSFVAGRAGRARLLYRSETNGPINVGYEGLIEDDIEPV